MRLFSLAAAATVIAVTIAGSAAADPLNDAATAALRGDFGIAARMYRPLAEAGVAVAQNNLGSLYARGLGVNQDHVEANRLYLVAAENGLAEAQNNLGFQYEVGNGV